MGVVYLLTLLVLVLATPGLAATYRATASGSDSANCTTATPCQSVERAVEFPTYAPGDVLELVCGETYREAATIAPNVSGTSSQPITVRATGSCFTRQGLHRGSNNAAVLSDSTADFTTLGVATGQLLVNLRDGSHCHVGSFTGTTITCSEPLAFGKENDWDTGDWYQIANAPRVTRAQRLTSWTNAGSNVWTATVSAHPARHVWIDGSSTNAQHWDGACTTGAMASATDKQFCTTASQVMVKSTSNPSTRWTKPGVEAALSPNQQTLWSQGTRNWWRFEGIAFEKVYGSLLTTGGASNLVFTNGRIGWGQRHNCTTGCWNGNAYSWLSGQDNRGGSGLGFSGGTNLTVTDSLIHDIDNNSLTYGGTTNMTGLVVRDTHLLNNFHSTLNSGISSSSLGSRTLTLTRVTFGGSCTDWHTGNTGASHTVTLTDVLFQNGFASGDARIFAPAEGCGGTGVHMFVQDPGSYAYTRVISRTTTNGLRASKGTHVISQSVFTDHDVLAINVNGSGTTVRLTDSIFTGNTGTGVNGAQVGCQFVSCTAASLFTSPSNNNKFDPASGTTIGYLAGVDTAVTLAEWQSRYGGDASSTASDACFVNAANDDFNLATGCNDIAAARGPFREITLSSASITGTTLSTTWTVGGTAPLTSCDLADATVVYDAAGQTITNCTANLPLSTDATLTMATAPTAGAAVTLQGAYGLVEDDTGIGGVLHARSRAFSATAVANSNSGWIVGADRVIPSGSNRYMLIGAIVEKGTVAAPPFSFSACSYGGQACSLVAAASATDAGNPEVHTSVWGCNEAALAAATSTVLACTPEEAEDPQRPVILLSGVYTSINQTTPVLDSETVTAANAPGVTAASLTTANPGVAVIVAGAGSNGVWTPDSGWTTQADVGEDATPGTRAFVADRATSGAGLASGASFLSDEPDFQTRLALVTVALNGGTGSDPNPPGTVMRAQTATRCAQYNEPLYQWLALENTACPLVQGGRVLVVTQYAVSAADEPSAVGKQLQCCDSGACTDPSEFYAVTATSGNVRYDPSPTLTHGQVIATRQLSDPGGTFVAGVLVEEDAMLPQALTAGQHSEVGYSLRVYAPAGSTVTCRLALDDNTPLNSYAQTATLTVVQGLALGF